MNWVNNLKCNYDVSLELFLKLFQLHLMVDLLEVLQLIFQLLFTENLNWIPCLIPNDEMGNKFDRLVALAKDAADTIVENLGLSVPSSNTLSH